MVAGIAGCSQHAATLTKSAVPATRDTLVDAGGYRLHFRVTGSGAPAIVLESGGGMDASQWTPLQSQLAQATGVTVVSYDRAGFGDSDLPQTAYDAKQEIANLHQGLDQLGLADDVVLVGHSYGGLLNQLYAKQFPTTVKGIVLIDPNTVAFVDAIGGPQKLMQIPFDEKLPLSKAQQAGVRQIRAFDKTIDAARSAPIAKTIPLTVITAGKPWWPKPEQSQAYRAAHESLTAEAPARSLIVAEGSGHNIPRERPDVVASAVEAMLASFHTGRH